MKQGINEHMIVHKRSQGLIDYAYRYAKLAHAGQKRKYTGEPYINHPIAVANLVASVTDDCEMICAALLHDVVEDTDRTLVEIKAEFGVGISTLVGYLTDVSKLSDGNRATRKAIDLLHTASASPNAKTIKLADLIDNSQSIMARDKGFAVVYMKEKNALLDVLTEGDRRLYEKASKIVADYYLGNPCATK